MLEVEEEDRGLAEPGFEALELFPVEGLFHSFEAPLETGSQPELLAIFLDFLKGILVAHAPLEHQKRDDHRAGRPSPMVAMDEERDPAFFEGRLHEVDCTLQLKHQRPPTFFRTIIVIVVVFGPSLPLLSSSQMDDVPERTCSFMMIMILQSQKPRVLLLR